MTNVIDEGQGQARFITWFSSGVFIILASFPLRVHGGLIGGTRWYRGSPRVYINDFPYIFFHFGLFFFQR